MIMRNIRLTLFMFLSLVLCNGGARADTLDSGATNRQTLHMRMTDVFRRNGLLYVRLQLENHEKGRNATVDAIVDTGANCTLILPESTARELELEIPSTGNLVKQVAGNYEVAVIRNINLDISGRLLLLYSQGNVKRGYLIDPIIGMGILRNLGAEEAMTDVVLSLTKRVK
jgi:predicted aspartyl protease